MTRTDEALPASAHDPAREDLLDRAMTRAFHAAIRLHRRHGLPLVTWADEEVRWVDARAVPLPEDSGSAG